MTARPENIWINIHRLATIFMPVLLGITGYFLTDVYGKMAVMDDRVRDLQVNAASTNGNRFSSVDWTRAKDSLDEERALLDRRITRLEEAIPPIKESLSRIEDKIDKIHESP
jgi:hypothetical protein